MFRQKQNCRSDRILISVDKKVYIVYRKAFGKYRKSFSCTGKLGFYYIKSALRECTIFNSHTEMIYDIMSASEKNAFMHSANDEC